MTSASLTQNQASTSFQYLIAIHPLGLLYGSAGPFLSPENLVGRAGAHFPPSSATLSGVFAAQYGDDGVQHLQLAGPFWAKTDTVENNSGQDFYVPTPFIYLIEQGSDEIAHTLSWQTHPDDSSRVSWLDQNQEAPIGKFESNTWLALSQWNHPSLIQKAPWTFLPHLHPRLELDQRRVAAPTEDDPDEAQGSLFLENAVQLPSDICLVYLANQPLDEGWYRFGGEGHMVEVTCHDLSSHICDRISAPLGRAFALLTPAIWGSNRLSQRYPDAWRDQLASDQAHQESILTNKPIPFRYRMGGDKSVKRLSRGRYAVPAGTVYVMRDEQPSWYEWPLDCFPREGPYLNRWGCGLALALPQAIGRNEQVEGDLRGAISHAVSKRIATA